MRFLSAYGATLCVSVLTACLLGWGGLTPAIAIIALLVGALAGLLAASSAIHARNCSGNGSPRCAPPRTYWEWFPVIVFALFALREFCWLFFLNGDSIKTLSPNNLGDLSLHITYIRYLANGVPFWPDNPIFAAGKLNYPLGTDLFNSLLLLVGVPIDRGLIWMGLIGSLATGLALWRWGRAFALAGFLFNGGLAGFFILKTLEVVDFQADLAWKSIPLSMFVTQRGLLYALPVGLMLLDQWRTRFFNEVSEPPGKLNSEAPSSGIPFPIWLEVLLYCTLPLFHVHTFLFLSFLLGIWFILGIARGSILKLIGISFLPATFLVSQISGFSGHHSMIHLLWGWMQGDQNFFLFWLLNFGALPILLGGLCVILLREFETRRTAALFVFPATVIFLHACFVMYAPWAWDNTKLMIWSYLVILPFLWSELIAPFDFGKRGDSSNTAGKHSKPLTRLAGQALICGALFFSGFLSLLGGIDGSHTGHEIAKRTEVESLGAVLKDLPKDAVFAGCPTWNHPLLLNGRKLALGYDGHLWSHGIDYQEPMHQLDDLMRGGLDWKQNATQLKVRYLFWGRMEEEKWPESLQPWKESCRCVLHSEWGAIYDLKTAR